MKNKFTITFFENSNGVTVGSLKYGEKRLLATTHPATIAYALQAMGAESVDIASHDDGVNFPLSSSIAPKRIRKIVGSHMPWMESFFIFVRIDSCTLSIIDEECRYSPSDGYSFSAKENGEKYTAFGSSSGLEGRTQKS